MSNESPLTGMEIAIVGMACRFPGARNVEEFWANLRDGVESITVLTREQLEESREEPESIDSPDYVPVARLIEGEDLFDAQLFNCSPREAEIIDPQQRILLECAWEAMESAGYDSERFPGLVGVYAGSKLNGYLWNLYSNPRIIQSIGDFQAQIANDKDYVATRIAYKLSLGGPAVTVQSACSTSLVAVHLACQGLLAGESDMALAGGVSVRLPQRLGYTYREGEILSPEGRVRAFDAQAQGTIFGNGMGMVVLRRLEDALADGDRIRAVIKGSAVNNDAAVKVGFTAPGVDGQVRVVRAAHLTAQVAPETISYIEAHGTGTLLGDPIEVRALTQAFRAGTDRRGFCAIGSVKTNIGHLGAAAGVAGLIKAVLALENGAIPPSLLFERPNPQIDFESSPFFVNTELRPWTRNGVPRRAGVSAFGIGGTNAHVVLEEAPAAPPVAPAREWQLLVLSAKTPTALDAVTARLREHLERHPEQELADVAFTLETGRRPLEHRRVLVCREHAEAVEVLAGGDAARMPSGVPEGPNPPVVFLFSGQGAQYAGMGRDLYRDEPVFRDEIDRCAALLQPRLGLDLRDLLYPASGTPEDHEEANRRLGRTAVTQPALFTIEWALARLWMSWGIRPEAMIGHSIGEYVAACVAGVFSLEDALVLVAERGRLMEGLPAGAMLSVPLPEAEVEALLGRQLSLAAVNAPGRCVVSGPEEAVAALEKQLAARGVACRRLHTSHAFHSGMMEPILPPFVERVAAMALHPPQIPYISNVTGGWIREAEATDPEYWARHLRGTVRFGDGLAELFQERTRVMLEVGPGQNLTTFCRQHPGRGVSRVIVSSLRHPREEHHDTVFLLRSLGALWLAGAAPDWMAFHAGETRRRVTLPTYPFERKRYWIAPGNTAAAFGGDQAALRRKSDVADFFHVPSWRPSPPPAPPRDGGPASWLVFADGCGLADALVARLRAEGRRADVVHAGAGFARLGDGAWEIDPGRREDYGALLAALRAEGAAPDAVAHLWGVTPAEGAAEYRETQTLGFYSLLWLAQALAGESGGVRLGVATTGVQRVWGTEALTPEKASVLGPCKVVPQENPRLSTVAVDVVLPPAGASLSGLAALADRLWAEIAAPAGERVERVVALRDGIRWVQEWNAVRLEQAAEERLPLREQGVYLVTGGLGGLGLVFADYLARSWRARLVLVGRSALPPREEWEALAASLPEDDTTGGRLRKLLALEAAGGEVLAASADVADEAAMRNVVTEAVARFGAVHGVIHAAGVAGGGVVQLKTDEVAERVLAPKILGTRALAAALAGMPLDFSLLCSSTIGVLGGFGQVDYCGANSFLDAWAHAAASRGERVVSVNWGAWDEVGMAVQTQLPRGARQAARTWREAPLPLPDTPPLHPLIDECLSRTEDRAVFLTRFDERRHWVVAEHRVAGTSAVPGTGYLEMARAAFQHVTGETAAEVRDVLFLAPVMVEEGEPREVRISLERGGEAWDFKVESRGDDGWQENARGRVVPLNGAPTQAASIAEIQARCTGRDEVIPAGVKPENEGQGLVYWGPRWQSLRRVQASEGEAVALLELPAEFAGDLEDGLVLHPALLDVATALSVFVAGGQESYLPLSYRRLRVRRSIPGRVWSHVRTHDGASRETLTADITLLDDAGEPVVEIEQFSLKRVGEAAGRFRRPAAKTAAANPLGVGGIRPAEGVEALRRLLSCPLGPQVAVSAKDLSALARQAVTTPDAVGGAGAGMAEGPTLALQEPMARYPRPDLKVPYAPPTGVTESLLVDIWQRVLGLEQVGIHDNFFELGGDSVMGIHVATRAAEAGLQVTPEQLFQYQTVAELAAALPETTGAPVPAMAEPALEETESGERFPLAHLDAETLERILAGREVEDLYPLSPLQQGFLFHSLSSPESGLYLEQMSCTLTGPLHVELMEQSWQHALDRHPVLRTSFLWEDLERPLQAVSPRVAMPLLVEDWRNLPEEEQRQRFEVARQADRERPFRLSEAPLMRLHLFRMADDVHRLLWTHHHLLMDGWSSPLLAQEVLMAYEQLRRGGELPPAPARRFRHYIEWLEGQDLGRAEIFWRQALAGFSQPTQVRADRPGDGSLGLSTDFERLDFLVPAETAASVQAVARQGQFTLNNVAQGLWALLLGRAAGEDDVIFGITVSSRPSSIPGIESMVGLFINALPIRVRIAPEEPLAGWLKGLQELQGALLQHAHTPLVDIQRWSEIPGDQPLFESIYEFWNFPLPSGEDDRLSVHMSDPHYDVATNYPLSLRVIPGEGLQMQITYDRRRFEVSTIERLRRDLEIALGAVATLGERPEARVGDLVAAVDEAEREERRTQAAEVSSVAQEKLRQRTRRRGTPTGAGV
ncbi:MAG TPA: SDR family NAD(P)-dependent oxidoreductase [Thermoanaerobaculia bacterium]|nr:SDR family NAD(P)-dependent oxidoreductase [Thermoanaerobaculia bacterium]